MNQWVCTKCKEPAVGREPDIRLLDNTYGSMRCSSTTCKNSKRVFHLEPNDRPLPRKEG